MRRPDGKDLNNIWQPVRKSVKQAADQQKRAFTAQLRENLPLKIFSLIISLLLFVYVQLERNPPFSRTFTAPVIRENAPKDVEIETEPQQVIVTIVGPRMLVERLKDSDIRAVADMKDIKADDTKQQVVFIKYKALGMTKKAQEELAFDPVAPIVRVQIFPPVSRPLSVSPLYPKEPPAGFHYGRPDVRPRSVTVVGRMDRVNRVERLIVNAAPTEMGAKIDGEFPVSARDKDDNPVDGISLIPSTVRLSVPLVEEPPIKTVPISPTIPDLPVPPYTLTDISAVPRLVKIIGPIERLSQIATIETESILVRDFTQTQEVTANLLLPPGIVVHDMNDRPIKMVKVRITIRKSASTSTIVPPSGGNVELPLTTREKKPNGTP